MSLPVPSSRESEDEFISRCAADPMAINKFADVSQRSALCQAQWASKVSKTMPEEPSAHENIKLSKPDAGYRCPAAKLGSRCGTCAYYDGRGKCAEVAGNISENCICNHWKRRQ